MLVYTRSTGPVTREGYRLIRANAAAGCKVVVGASSGNHHSKGAIHSVHRIDFPGSTPPLLFGALEKPTPIYINLTATQDDSAGRTKFPIRNCIVIL